MYVTCDKCGEEIEIVDIYAFRGSYDEPPSFEYGFAEDHPCQETWTDKEQDDFDKKVYDSYSDECNSEPDYYYEDDIPF